MSLLRRPADGTLMSLVEEAGRNVQRSGLLLKDLLLDYPEHAALAKDLKVCEQEGDRITHDIIHRLDPGHGLERRRSSHDLGGRLDVRRAGLPAVGLLTVGPHRQLPGGGIRSGHHLAGVEDGRLRRERPALEARRRRSNHQEREPGGADPDVPRRDYGQL